MGISVIMTGVLIILFGLFAIAIGRPPFEGLVITLLGCIIDIQGIILYRISEK